MKTLKRSKGPEGKIWDNKCLSVAGGSKEHCFSVGLGPRIDGTRYSFFINK